MDLNEIDIDFEGDGRLFCVGRIDALGAAEWSGMAEDGAPVYDCPTGFVVEVVRDGEIWVDGAMTPLLPGVYRSTDCGLMLDGVPVLGARTD